VIEVLVGSDEGTVGMKFATRVPGPFTVMLVVESKVMQEDTDTQVIVHPLNEYPEFGTADIEFPVEPSSYQELGLVVPPILGLAANCT
jgi:hypothetical protein